MDDSSSPLPPQLSLPPGGALTAGPDPDLLGLPAPPRRARTLSLCLMAATGLLALILTAWLWNDVLYALRSSTPQDIGDLGTLAPSPTMKDTFVRSEGVLGNLGSMRYERAFEDDSFRLAEVRNNPRIWVELRVPDGVSEAGPDGAPAAADGVRLIPPTTFVGRFVPLADAGLRYRGLARKVRLASGITVPDDAWILVDGATPHGSSWAIPLAALLGVFAAWNLAYVARLARRIPG